MSDPMIAIVTGAASGLGAATARRFAADGASLVLADIDEAGGRTLADALGAQFVHTDVTDEAQVASLVDAAVARHGRLDCIVNNAGALGAMGGIEDLSAAEWRHTMAILLDSVFYGMKHGGRAIKAGGRGGCILSTTSVGGIAALAPHAYTTAKHAIVGLTKSVASELARHRIRVNAVAPGQVVSGLTASAYGNEAQLRAFAMARNPMGTMVEASEIAGAFAYLAGPDGVNVTGQVLTVDAGLVECRLPEAYYRRDGLGNAPTGAAA
jgi:NAD(P)-dependent dehydrogenase (short-subunit alcohol dehydrogenase family)